MKYAIIKLQGRQHRVEEGQKLIVDQIDEKVGGTLTIKDVLLYVDGDTVEIGQPTVAAAQVKAKILSHELGEKIRVATYKAKSKERKVRGHRQRETTVEIQSISAK